MFVETVLGGLGALVVLAVVFASALAVLPLVMAIVAIPTTFLLLLGLTELTTVNFVLEFLIGLVGLGVAIDYSLLVTTRWREETPRRSPENAVVVAMVTAGRSVLFSGVTVAIGLLALVQLPVPFLHSMGYGGVLIPLVSVAVALTLLPVCLASVGPRLDRRRLGRRDSASPPWFAWARLVDRARRPAAIVGLVILAALIEPATSLNVGDPLSSSLARSGPAYEGLKTLRSGGVPTGVLDPLVVLVRRPAQAPRVAARLAALPGCGHRCPQLGARGGLPGVGFAPMRVSTTTRRARRRRCSTTPGPRRGWCSRAGGTSPAMVGTCTPGSSRRSSRSAAGWPAWLGSRTSTTRSMRAGEFSRATGMDAGRYRPTDDARSDARKSYAWPAIACGT